MDDNHEESERTMRLSHFTIEHAPDGVVWIDSEGRVYHVNEAICRMFGHSRDELIGAYAHEFHLEVDEEIWREEWRKQWAELKENKVLNYERPHLTKDGDWIPLEITQNFIEFEGTEYSCVFFRDITERKRAEEELRESQRKLATLINNLPGAVYRLKPVPDTDKMALEFISEWAQNITGYPLEEFIQRHASFIHPDDMETVRELFWEAMKEHKPGELVYRIVTAEGDVKWVMDRSSGIYSEEGELIAVEGFFTDITDRIRTEEALKNALVEVEGLKNQLQEENIYLRQEIQLTHNFEDIICQSEVFKDVLRHVEQVASTDATVLVLGETGTGKELIVRAVHSISARQDRPLVKVNCAALPANLIESELFGHEKGAFTGALARKIGRFELANGGTIFLDEIGELPLDLQIKLLRVLQEKEFERLGNPKTISVDVRVIAATNRDLEQAIEKGTFREDLFYRLNVFPIHIPPLRKRKEDIPLLVNHFVQKYSTKVGKRIDTVSQNVMERLQAYQWPGNVRELENILERAVIISRGTRLELGDWFLQKETPSEVSKMVTLEEVERAHIIEVLELTHWRIRGEKGAAEILGLKPTTLEARMKKLEIKRKH